MIDFISIRNDIVTGLNQYITPNKIIMQDQNAPKPTYPFATFNFINTYIEQQIGTPIELVEEDQDESTNAKYTRIEQPTMTISITSYSKTIGESEQLALNMLKWFKYIGYEYLKEKGIIIVDSTDIKERNTLIVDDYERRYGFDITIRVVSEVERVIEAIEIVEI
jgi:hypothetical protein